MPSPSYSNGILILFLTVVHYGLIRSAFEGGDVIRHFAPVVHVLHEVGFSGILILVADRDEAHLVEVGRLALPLVRVPDRHIRQIKLILRPH